MQDRVYPLTMLELMEMLTTGRSRLAVELITELREHERLNQRKS